MTTIRVTQASSRGRSGALFGCAAVVATIIGCSAPPPASPNDSIEAKAAAPGETAPVTAPEAGCEEVLRAFAARDGSLHTRRHGFPESLDAPERFPIVEGTLEENADALDGALADYEAIQARLAEDLRSPADRFATAVRSRAANLRKVAAERKRRAERDAATSSDPELARKRALEESLCFGTMAVVSAKCPESVLSGDVLALDDAATALEQRCGSAPRAVP